MKELIKKYFYLTLISISLEEKNIFVLNLGYTELFCYYG